MASASASSNAPSFKVQNEEPEAKPLVKVSKGYEDDEKGNPQLSSVKVVNDTYPKFQLEFDVSSKSVRIPSAVSVPFILLAEMATRLSVTLNQAQIKI
jgi:hypothetical protein